MWHVLRYGRRGRLLGAEVEIGDRGLAVSTAHNGCDHLPGRPRHCRELRVENHRAIVVTDRLEGRGVHQLQGELLIEPSWRVEPTKGGWSGRQATAESSRQGRQHAARGQYPSLWSFAQPPLPIDLV